MSMTEDTHLDTDTVETTEGGETVVSDSKVDENEILNKINGEIGGTYKTLEDAITGFKEARSAIGRYGSEAGKAKQEAEALAAKIADPNSFVSKEQYEQDMFYSKKPELEPYRDIINSRARELKLSVQEVVEKDESLKSSLTKLQGYDDTEKAKSVLMSNPRLGQVTDKLKLAQEEASKGDYTSAENNAVGAIMDIYGK